MKRLINLAAVMGGLALVVAAMFAPLASSASGVKSTDHHRTLTVYWDFTPKQTDKITLLPEDYVTVYKLHPRLADSEYEVEVQRNGVTILERTYPATFRYVSVTHDCNLSCLPGD